MHCELEVIIASLAPQIRSWGFDGTDLDYRKSTQGAICVVSFQPSTRVDGFYINVGVQPDFVPDSTGAMPSPSTIREPECIFRSRVDPPEGWFCWPYDCVAADLELVQDSLTDKYLEYVVPLMTIPGPLTEVTLEDFAENPVHPLFGPGNSLTFLHLARIAKACDRPNVAVKFVERGIEACDRRASGLLHRLQTVIRDE